jgi:hypothetical protein
LPVPPSVPSITSGTGMEVPSSTSGTEDPSTSGTIPQWYQKDIDAMSFAELKDLQKELGVKAASAKKIDIITALKEEAKKHQ